MILKKKKNEKPAILQNFDDTNHKWPALKKLALIRGLFCEN